MYQIKVNGNKSYAVSQDSLDALDAVKTGKNQFHILQNNSSVKAKILDSNFYAKTYTVKVNNNNYEVVIKDDLDQLISEMGFSLQANKQVNSIKAPMPGLILEINVEEGQEVKEDDTLLILEAMKMENVITSPREGVIKSIQVKQADTVEKNSLLIEFE